MGNSMFGDLFRRGGRHTATARFVNRADPVPRLPPHAPPWGYCHVCAPTTLDATVAALPPLPPAAGLDVVQASEAFPGLCEAFPAVHPALIAAVVECCGGAHLTRACGRPTLARAALLVGARAHGACACVALTVCTASKTRGR